MHKVQENKQLLEEMHLSDSQGMTSQLSKFMMQWKWVVGFNTRISTTTFRYSSCYSSSVNVITILKSLDTFLLPPCDLVTIKYSDWRKQRILSIYPEASLYSPGCIQLQKKKKLFDRQPTFEALLRWKQKNCTFFLLPFPAGAKLCPRHLQIPDLHPSPEHHWEEHHGPVKQEINSAIASFALSGESQMGRKAHVFPALSQSAALCLPGELLAAEEWDLPSRTALVRVLQSRGQSLPSLKETATRSASLRITHRWAHPTDAWLLGLQGLLVLVCILWGTEQ